MATPSSDTGVTIERAEPVDVASVVALVEVAYAPYVARMDRPPAPMLDDYVQLVEQRVVWIAKRAGVILGAIVMWADEDDWYIDNVATSPRVRGEGIGALLLDHAAVQANAAGKPALKLYTNVAMHENLDYYRRRGFVETHRIAEHGYERIYFRRDLDPDATNM